MTSDMTSPTPLSIRQTCFECFERGERPMQIVRRLGFKKSTVLTYHHQFLVSHRPTPLRSSFDFWSVTEEALDSLSRTTGLPDQFLWERYGKFLNRSFELRHEVPANYAQAAQQLAAEKLIMVQAHIVVGEALDSPAYSIMQILWEAGMDTRGISREMRRRQLMGSLSDFDRDPEIAAEQWAATLLTFITMLVTVGEACHASPIRIVNQLKKQGLDLSHFPSGTKRSRRN